MVQQRRKEKRGDRQIGFKYGKEPTGAGRIVKERGREIAFLATFSKKLMHRQY